MPVGALLVVKRKERFLLLFFVQTTDELVGGGLTRGEALRQVYMRRFESDPGPIDAASFSWLWEDAAP